MEREINENNSTPSLSELRKEKRSQAFLAWMHKHLPFLFDIRSLFYYGLLVFVLGILWCIYSLVANHFTQFYPWTDYTGQYVTFTYSFYDAWHKFFKTGVFELYGTDTYLGTDNIGSNSYYGLFDPFLIICYIFPRAIIPHTFVIATFFKGVVGALATRAYLKYLGVSEGSSRIGGLAFAFNGYLNFMVGFPSVVSMCSMIPLVLLGIEKVIKEKKVLTLSIALGLLGLISFFFLVVVCIFGVLYAIWRYLWTIKQRNWKNNIAVPCLGVMAFACGIMLCSWSLLPSLRESSLSGRTISIGAAYLNSLKTSIATFDFKTAFARLFELVGRHPGRELQGLIGFFYPTYGYLALPIASGMNANGGIQYDAWVASLFCYTPCVILFWIAFVSSIRRKKVSHMVAFVLIGYLVFTNFAYYFFYAFTGDGYGRWYIVLVPIIIYYACQELDRLKEEPKWVPISGAATSLFLATLTWILCIVVLKDKTFETSLTTYWVTRYSVPSVVNGHSTLWIVYFQLGMDLIVSLVLLFVKKREILLKTLGGIIMAETILWGNMSFAYMGTWNYNGWNGGVEYRNDVTDAFSKINSFDGNTFYRAFIEGMPENNAQEVFDFNGTSNFHSLFNYDVNQLALYSHMNRHEYQSTAYDQTYYNKSWSAFYGNKRIGADVAFNIKYYGVKREGYGEWENCNVDPEISKYVNTDNVPWDSTLVYGDARNKVRVYHSSLVDENSFGHAVDELYKENRDPSSTYVDDFYMGNASTYETFNEINRNEEVYTKGAIVKDEDVDLLTSEGFLLSLAPAKSSLLKSVSLKKTIYRHEDTNFLGYSSKDNKTYGPTYFLNHSESKRNTGMNYVPDYETVVFTPNDGSKYFNSDSNGAYFSLLYNFTNSTKTRIYLIGDYTDDNGRTYEDQLLSYDYNTMSAYQSRKVGGASSADVFGFYPKGKVKYLCLNAKPSDYSNPGKDNEAASISSSYGLYVANRTDVEAFYNKYKNENYALKDVVYSTNKATFSSNFDAKKVVVTTLGYDAGWRVFAHFEDGSSKECQTLKLDGGFVGFIAPQGNVSYVMKYQTPYLKEGAILASVAILTLATYTIARFVYQVKKKEKELA